jgi:hypothetical protein
MAVYESFSGVLEDDRRLREAVPGSRSPQGGGWEGLFVEGSIFETVLMPQFAGSQGTTTQEQDH